MRSSPGSKWPWRRTGSEDDRDWNIDVSDLSVLDR